MQPEDEDLEMGYTVCKRVSMRVEECAFRLSETRCKGKPRELGKFHMDRPTQSKWVCVKIKKYPEILRYQVS